MKAIGRVAPAAGGRAMAVGLAVEQHLARIECMDAGQQLDQGRLAGAVLAEQGQDRAGADVEVDAVDGERAAEALGDAGEAQQRWRVSHVSPRRSPAPLGKLASTPPLMGAQCRGASNPAQGPIASACDGCFGVWRSQAVAGGP